MKLLSIAIPSYNSQDYLNKAVESLLPGGDRVEILIVNDGSKDRTAEIADDFEARYPGIVKAVHKENGGHGDAVMTGLANATGRYFKVVDSDDRVDPESLIRVLDRLESLTEKDESLDMLICNYVYDKVGVKHKHVMKYTHLIPEDRFFTWQDTHFPIGRYLLMHSVIYRTQLLRDCGLTLPKHTFYVDELYVYQPLPMVKRMMYMDEDLYLYFIGRDDQSVQESVMIRRIDQALLVNRMLLDAWDLQTITDKSLRKYMRNFAEIITTVSSVLLIKSGTEENLQKKDALWAYIREHHPELDKELRHRFFGFILTRKSTFSRKFAVGIYQLTQKIVGFN